MELNTYEDVLDWFLRRSGKTVSAEERSDLITHYKNQLHRLFDVNYRTMLRVAVSLGLDATIDDLDAACGAELARSPHLSRSFVYATEFTRMTLEEVLSTEPFAETESASTRSSDRAYDVWTCNLSNLVQQYEPMSQSNAMAATRAWIEQFEQSSRVALLEALTRTLSRTFIRRTDIETYFCDSVTNQNFWDNVYLVNSPGYGGQSGQIFTDFVAQSVKNQFSISLFDDRELSWLNSDSHILIDDAIFSGNRALKDYRNDWLNWKSIRIDSLGGRHERHLRLFVWSYLRHRSGEDRIRNVLTEEAQRRGITVSVTFRSKLVYEDRTERAHVSDVLWPRQTSDNSSGSRTEEERHALRPDAFTKSQVFDSARSRHILEDQLLSAGNDIISRFNNTYWTPLGLGRPPFGFGSLSVSYRNCPNNAPLALWWSTQNWCPLFPRDVYASREENIRPVVIVPSPPKDPLIW